ncbi:MAG: cytochrome c [Rhodospirillaceae bacterium]|jgi:mono/diheme cytochrome c family protein|nr:cytochrome c [Rhodospirillaceae bacterium]MBT6116765.1 cytochrome c [Rhodospirillaceae bacterium]
MISRKLGLGVAALALLAGAATIAFMQGESVSKASAETADLARGARVYAEYCASCHGANLEGEANWRTRKPDGRLPAPPQDATGHTWHHPDAVLFEIVKQGTEALAPPGYKSDMPGFADSLSDAEIHDVLAYIRSRWPAEIRARQAAISAGQGG